MELTRREFGTTVAVAIEKVIGGNFHRVFNEIWSV